MRQISIFRLQLSDSEEEFDFLDLTEDDLGKPVRKMPAPAAKTEAHCRVPQQLPQKPSSDFIPKVVSRILALYISKQKIMM